MWKTYKEVYEEVLQIGSALRAAGAEPVNISLYLLSRLTCVFEDLLFTS